MVSTCRCASRGSEGQEHRPYVSQAVESHSASRLPLPLGLKGSWDSVSHVYTD